MEGYAISTRYNRKGKRGSGQRKGTTDREGLMKERVFYLLVSRLGDGFVPVVIPKSPMFVFLKLRRKEYPKVPSFPRLSKAEMYRRL